MHTLNIFFLYFRTVLDNIEWYYVGMWNFTPNFSCCTFYDVIAISFTLKLVRIWQLDFYCMRHGSASLWRFNPMKAFMAHTSLFNELAIRNFILGCVNVLEFLMTVVGTGGAHWCNAVDTEAPSSFYRKIKSVCTKTSSHHRDNFMCSLFTLM